MPVSFSDFLLSLRGDAAECAFTGFDPSMTRLRFPRVRRACFHLILDGETEVGIAETGERAVLRPGDFCLFIQGNAHDLGNPAADPVTLPDDAFRVAEEPRDVLLGRPVARILSGFFGLEQFREEMEVRKLPPMLVNSLREHSAFAGMFAAPGRESLLALCRGPGGRAFAGTLVRMFYVETVRRTFERMSVSDPVDLRNLGISQIAAARRLIHAEPGRAWTVETMARAVGMSRSVFARRFHEVVGETPLHYLAGVRFSHARRLIDAGASVAAAASHVGYASPSAFARAFARHTGHPPSRRTV